VAKASFVCGGLCFSGRTGGLTLLYLIVNVIVIVIIDIHVDTHVDVHVMLMFMHIDVYDVHVDAVDVLVFVVVFTEISFHFFCRMTKFPKNTGSVWSNTWYLYKRLW
jgi:hypothetical protein